MLFPDVQEKARKEIGRPPSLSNDLFFPRLIWSVDKVVPDRLPEYADLERIPYVRCLMKETWRWRPPVALGHPHCTTRELEYEGYRIPAGARLHINAWYELGQDICMAMKDKADDDRPLGPSATTQRDTKIQSDFGLKDMPTT